MTGTCAPRRSSQTFTYDELNRIKTAQTQATTGALCSVKNDATITSSFRFNNRVQPERMHVTTTGAPATPCDAPTQTANILDFTYSFDTDPGAGVANNGPAPSRT